MKFSESHEWVELEGEIATIGITNWAQNELGDIVYVELPMIGHHVDQDEEVIVLESTKAAVDLYSPLSGEIMEANTALKEAPEKINQSAQSEGWLYKLKIADMDEYESLMDQVAYDNFMKS